MTNVTPRDFRARKIDVTLHHDAHGWFFDGPACYGPRAVRTSGRGPYWRGQVSPQFAAVLLKKLRDRDLLDA